MTRIIQRALAGLCAGLLLVIAADLFQVANQTELPLAEGGELRRPTWKQWLP
jgi:hypothetical protein